MVRDPAREHLLETGLDVKKEEEKEEEEEEEEEEKVQVPKTIINCVGAYIVSFFQEV
jgi:hypothetical protein